ncbi:MAG: hypothetical protein R3B47_18680 [Bacteroidia bacterium]
MDRVLISACTNTIPIVCFSRSPRARICHSGCCDGRDPYGTLWIGTQKGLLRYDGNDFLGIEERNGLLSSEINALYAMPRKDELWLGTSKGVSIIEHANAPATFEFPVSSFELNDFSAGEKRRINQGDPLAFRLINHDHLFAGHTRTQYSLDGGPWIWFEGRKSLQNLPSGNHLLNLRGRLNHTGWYQLEPIRFKVRP